LSDFGASGNYFERQVRRWTQQYRASQTDELVEVERLIAWLPKTVPEQTRTAIIHGDYRIDNLIFARGMNNVASVLDWELATIGDPLADFAYFAMHWILPHDGKAGLGGCDLDKDGIPSLGEIAERYCEQTGRDTLPRLHWYFAYNMFRLVGIAQGIKKRVDQGNASSQEAINAIQKIEPLARLAWAEACMANTGITKERA
jgi:aminoglycoside phosphotransferase (APT) family kinase protein